MHTLMQQAQFTLAQQTSAAINWLPAALLAKLFSVMAALLARCVCA